MVFERVAWTDCEKVVETVYLTVDWWGNQMAHMMDE